MRYLFRCGPTPHHAPSSLDGHHRPPAYPLTDQDRLPPEPLTIGPADSQPLIHPYKQQKMSDLTAIECSSRLFSREPIRDNAASS
jgi:hypothetical protein